MTDKIIFEQLEKLSSSLDIQIRAQEKLIQDANDVSYKMNVELESLKNQKADLQKQITDLKNNIIDFMDKYDSSKMQTNQEKYDNNNNLMNTQQKQVDVLKDLMNQNSQSKYMQSKLKKRIEKKEAILLNLKQKNVKLESKQRSIVMKKQTKLNKKNALLAKQQAKADVSLERSYDNIDLNKQSDTFGEKLVTATKAKLYHKNYEHQQQVLQQMQSKNVGFVGANVMVITKNAKNTLKNGWSKLKNVANRAKEQLNAMFDYNYVATQNTNSNTHTL